jgi:hypothetical protein
MKRATWLLSTLAVTALVAVLAAPAVEAACASPINFGSGSYPYVNYTTAPPTASLNTANGSLRIGHFWEPGKRATQNEGSFSSSIWWHQFGPTYPFYVSGQMDIGVQGCPGVPPGQGGGAASDGGCSTTVNNTCPAGYPNEMIITLLDADFPTPPGGGNAYYYVLRPSFYLLDFPEFLMAPANLNSCPGWSTNVLQPLPRANVSTSSRVDSNTVALNFSLADVAPGFRGFNDSNDDPNDGADPVCAAKSPYATITGYNICQFEGTGDPGRLASSGWTCTPGPATGPGGAVVTNFQVDCADVTPPIDNDKFVAIQLRINGGPPGGYDTEYVSKSTRVECDPNLAQPEEAGGRRVLTPTKPTQGKRPR